MPNNLAHQLEDQLTVHVFPSTTLDAITRLLWDRELCAVPVLAPHRGAVIGVVTQRDVAICSWLKGSNQKELTAWQAMQTDLTKLYDDDSTQTELTKLWADIVAAAALPAEPPPPAEAPEPS